MIRRMRCLRSNLCAAKSSAKASSISGLDGGLDARKSSTGCTMPRPKNWPQTRFAIAFAKYGFSGVNIQSAKVDRGLSRSVFPIAHRQAASLASPHCSPDGSRSRPVRGKNTPCRRYWWRDARALAFHLSKECRELVKIGLAPFFVWMMMTPRTLKAHTKEHLTEQRRERGRFTARAVNHAWDQHDACCPWPSGSREPSGRTVCFPQNTRGSNCQSCKRF